MQELFGQDRKRVDQGKGVGRYTLLLAIHGYDHQADKRPPRLSEHIVLRQIRQETSWHYANEHKNENRTFINKQP